MNIWYTDEDCGKTFYTPGKHCFTCSPPNMPANLLALTDELRRYYDYVMSFNMEKAEKIWHWRVTKRIFLKTNKRIQQIEYQNISIEYPGEDVTPEDFAKVLDLYEL